jgi:hypothetical protein
MMLKIFIPTWLLTWAILLPIDAVGTQVEGKTGLDQLTYGNIDPRHQSRLWAHLIMAYVFTCEYGQLDPGYANSFQSTCTL